MAKVKKYNADGEKMTSVWNNKGDKRYGFVSKDRAYDDNAKTRYGIGIDNMGNPYRGASDNELKTLLGTLDYGYDGDTVYGGFTPNFYAGGGNSPLPGGGDESTAYAGLGDYQLRANRFSPQGENPLYAMGLNFPDDTRIPDVYKSFNTPLGELSLGTNDGNPNIGGSFQPNDRTNYYIQALANLLRGQR